MGDGGQTAHSPTLRRTRVPLASTGRVAAPYVVVQYDVGGFCPRVGRQEFCGQMELEPWLLAQDDELAHKQRGAQTFLRPFPFLRGPPHAEGRLVTTLSPSALAACVSLSGRVWNGFLRSARRDSGANPWSRP